MAVKKRGRPGRKPEFVGAMGSWVTLGRDAHGRDRRSRLTARAQFETRQNLLNRRPRPVVTKSDLLRRAADMYLAVYPPPGEESESV